MVEAATAPGVVGLPRRDGVDDHQRGPRRVVADGQRDVVPATETGPQHEQVRARDPVRADGDRQGWLPARLGHAGGTIDDGSLLERPGLGSRSPHEPAIGAVVPTHPVRLDGPRRRIGVHVQRDDVAPPSARRVGVPLDVPGLLARKLPRRRARLRVLGDDADLGSSHWPDHRSGHRSHRRRRLDGGESVPGDGMRRRRRRGGRSCGGRRCSCRRGGRSRFQHPRVLQGDDRPDHDEAGDESRGPPPKSVHESARYGAVALAARIPTNAPRRTRSPLAAVIVWRPTEGSGRVRPDQREPQ